MSSDYPRSHRVADFIQRELSGLIRSEVKDPRVSPMLTISSVDVSRDLSVAKVYYSLMDPQDRVETQDALNRASGFLRGKLAKQMNTRTVPLLRFYYDDSAAHGAHMSALIANAVASNTTAGDETGESSETGESGESSESGDLDKEDSSGNAVPGAGPAGRESP